MLDYALVAAVAAVVREGSFERAAGTLHITASAVSQRVRLLEERIGRVLVVRGTPCTATNAGVLVCRHAEQVGMLEHDLGRALPPASGEAPGTGGSARVTLRLAVNADSLSTWFIAAAAAFAAQERALLDIGLDDQEHTAERLRSGEVLAAVTALAAPVAGCRSVPLGSMHYVAVASPAFARLHFAGGVGAASLQRAPNLTFNRKDRLQDAWMAQVCGTAPDGAPRHWLPATQAFVDAGLAGLGWGMSPLPLVQMHRCRPIAGAGARQRPAGGAALAARTGWCAAARSPHRLRLGGSPQLTRPAAGPWRVTCGRSAPPGRGGWETPGREAAP